MMETIKHYFLKRRRERIRFYLNSAKLFSMDAQPAVTRLLLTAFVAGLFTIIPMSLSKYLGENFTLLLCIPLLILAVDFSDYIWRKTYLLLAHAHVILVVPLLLLLFIYPSLPATKARTYEARSETKEQRQQQALERETQRRDKQNGITSTLQAKNYWSQNIEQEGNNSTGVDVDAKAETKVETSKENDKFAYLLEYMKDNDSQPATQAELAERESDPSQQTNSDTVTNINPRLYGRNWRLPVNNGRYMLASFERARNTCQELGPLWSIPDETLLQSIDPFPDIPKLMTVWGVNAKVYALDPELQEARYDLKFTGRTTNYIFCIRKSSHD